jgi:acyl-CoA thioesterase-2
MNDVLAELLGTLDLETLEVNLFRGTSPQVGWQRVFGGQVLGQALVACQRSVEAHRAHSLHAYFLRAGDPAVPIIYQVDRTRDGRSFTTRRVTALQHGRAIFHLEASFHAEEEGAQHRIPAREESPPEPESLPTRNERLAELAKRLTPEQHERVMSDRAFDIRYVREIDPLAPRPQAPQMAVWLRFAGTLPDDLSLHQALLAYASDYLLLDAVGLPHGMDILGTGFQLASLDHAMWFHRPFRADEWLLYEIESPTTGAARGFATGRLYTRTGELAASVAQEGLFRRSRDGV